MPATPQFDLAIVGGGPAGSSAAITAARAGASVVLLEARSFPRHKVCGEFVSAESLDVLADLLRDVPSTRAMFDDAPVIDRTRLFLGCRVLEAAVIPPALSIPRYALDTELWQAAGVGGVDARANCEVSDLSGDGPIRLQTCLGEITAKAVIVAAGRWSQFVGERSIPAGPKWLGVKAHFREPNAAPTTDLYFFEQGYCGVQPVGHDTVNACAMVRSDRAKSLTEVFQLHPRLAERAAAWEPLSQPVNTAPLIYRTPEPTRGNVLLVGDAAAFIDPFVGDGISIALRSGRAAAVSLLTFLRGNADLPAAVNAYCRAYSREFQPLLSAAARIRSLLALPGPARALVFELLRFPGVMPFVIRQTRRAG